MYEKRSILSFPQRLASLIGKTVTIRFNNGDQLIGKLVGFDSHHLNLVLVVDEKLTFLRGSAITTINEGEDPVIRTKEA